MPPEMLLDMLPGMLPDRDGRLPPPSIPGSVPGIEGLLGNPDRVGHSSADEHAHELHHHHTILIKILIMNENIINNVFNKKKFLRHIMPCRLYNGGSVVPSIWSVGGRNDRFGGWKFSVGHQHESEMQK